jgi:uncharacterized protein YraI
MRTFMRVALTGAASALLVGTASAQTVSATTDLNVRAGPGPQHPVIGVIGAGQSVNLNGCLESGKWCSVVEAGGEGWVYSDYLTGEFGGKTVVLTERPANSGVTIVKDKGGGDAGAVTGGVTGAIIGAVVGGPVGAAVGGAAGAVAGGAAGTVIDPPATVKTYVTANRMDPVYLEGEVVVGAGLPETVELREVPDYKYRYAYVNSQAVLVDPDTRQIVYVVR